jgi:arylsulfatase A-like enzyme
LSRLRRLGLASLAAATFFLHACSPTISDKKSNVVLIIIDTIRADRLGCYGYPIATSPNIDALASEGMLFEQAVTCAPVTLPSVSAILTSTYPAINNVRYNGKFFLSDASVTLAEILRDNGYETGAFIGGFPLDSRFGVDQGFDIYDDDFSRSTDRRPRQWIGHETEDFERTAAEVNERVFDWLESVKDEKFFLMAHYFDPHWPYEAPAPYNDGSGDAYNSEIAYTDEHVGKLIAKLEELGLKDDTLIVLTGDHGESLGAHGEPTHGDYLFDTTIRVPLIFQHEGRVPKGLRIGTMVKTIDIMPTIIDFLGLPKGPHTQGDSLVPTFEGKPGEPAESPILLETMLPFHESKGPNDPPAVLRGLRTSDWKMIYITIKRGSQIYSTEELYQVGKEPLELFDVREANQRTFVGMLMRMHSMLKTYSTEMVADDNRMEMDSETRRKLKSLGYLK